MLSWQLMRNGYLFRLFLAIEEVPGEAGENDEQNRVTEYFVRQNGAECHEGENNPTVRVDEGGWFDEDECRGGDEPEDRETQHPQGLLVIRIAFESRAEPEIGFAYTEHDNQAGKNNGCGCQNAAPKTGGCVTDIGRTVDAYRSRCDLANSHNINEFLLVHPSVSLHLHLDKREDSKTASEAEKTDLEEAEKELQINHLCLLSVMSTANSVRTMVARITQTGFTCPSQMSRAEIKLMISGQG